MADDITIKLVLDQKNATANLKKFGRELQGLEGGAKKAKENTTSAFSSLKSNAGRLLGAAGVAGIAFSAGRTMQQGFQRAIEKGSEFEAQLSNLQAITGIAGENLDRLGVKSLSLSERWATSASDIIEANKLVASQLSEDIDFNTEVGLRQLENVTEQALILSRAADIDLKTAVETTTQSINQFGLAAGDADDAINILAAGAKFGAAEVPDLARSFENAGTAARSAGISMAETTTAIEFLAKNALRGEKSGTALRAIFLRLQTASQDLAEFGIEDVDLKTDGLATTMQKLQPILNNTTALKKIFGEEAFNAAQILIQESDNLDEFTAKLEGTNTAQEQAAAQTSNFRFESDRLNKAIDARLIPAFQNSSGFLTTFVGGLADAVTGLGNFMQAQNELADATSRLLPLLNEQAVSTVAARSAGISELLSFVRQQEALTEARIQGITKIADNEEALTALKTTTEAQVNALTEQLDLTQEGSERYARLTIQVEESQRVLDALNEVVVTNASATGEAGDSTETLTDRIDALKKSNESIITQSGDLTDAQIVRLQQNAAEIKSLEQLIQKRQELLEQSTEPAGPTGPVSTQQVAVRSVFAGQTDNVSLDELSPEEVQLNRQEELQREIRQEVIRTVEGGGDLETVMARVADQMSESKAESVAISQATQLIASSMLNAAIQGQSFLGVLKQIVQQLSSRALLTFLKIATDGSLSLGGGTFFKGLFGGLFAEGGFIRGPGTGTSDSIPAAFEPGSFVVNAASAAAAGPILEQITKSGRVPAFVSDGEFAVSPGRAKANAGLLTAINSDPALAKTLSDDFQARADGGFITSVSDRIQISSSVNNTLRSQAGNDSSEAVVAAISRLQQSIDNISLKTEINARRLQVMLDNDKQIENESSLRF